MQGLIRDLKRNRTAYLMAVPAVILLLVFSYAPMYGILIAFKNINRRWVYSAARG